MGYDHNAQAILCARCACMLQQYLDIIDRTSQSRNDSLARGLVRLSGHLNHAPTRRSTFKRSLRSRATSLIAFVRDLRLLHVPLSWDKKRGVWIQTPMAFNLRASECPGLRRMSCISAIITKPLRNCQRFGAYAIWTFHFHKTSPRQIIEWLHHIGQMQW